jgi:GrpB-like predicted nucleotidyltransferase (UPF0157 family)
MLSDEDITTFRDDADPPDTSPYVPGAKPTTDIGVVPYDPAWPGTYERVAHLVRIALGPRVLDLAHVGSTAVPDLAAKPVIDIDLTVADSDDEASYVPALQKHGFRLLIREPWWYGHRLLQHPGPRTNLHVWSPDCPEAARHLIFRDWLKTHPDDQQLYLAAKQDAVDHTNETGGHIVDYNFHKQTVIREIYARAFAALGML